MRVAVILSSYNSPERLEKVLCGYSIQQRDDFELLVADDGSTDETRQVVKRASERLDLNIRHVWHEDDGFRKCTILNKALAATEADYLIFSDGDCVPRADFVASHVALGRPGRYLSGGCFRLTQEATRALTCEQILAGRATDLGFIGPKLPRLRLKKYRLALDSRAAAVLDLLTTTRPTWNGHNSSCWRRDALAVNGFDERMRYGGEDREFGERLVNIGIRPLQVRHRAVCVHLWHDRDYICPEGLAENLRIRRLTRSRRTHQTAHGVAESCPDLRARLAPAELREKASGDGRGVA
jgi:glycosyltransferase involved in cell wall biosynthesis